MVVAFVALGVAAARGRSVKVVAGVVGLVVGVVALVAVEDGVGAIVPESAGWVAEEVGLWVGGRHDRIALLAPFAGAR